jgi:hypothetical protein
VRFEYPDPFEIVELGDDDSWEGLFDEYRKGSANPRPLQRCLEVAREGGATTAVVEGRYLDRDYRSEYMAHLAKRFESLGAVTRRLHFFRSALDAERVWRLPDDVGYLGYMVIRPTQFGTVGRTVLVPPPSLLHAVRTSVEDRVYFFGQLLTVEGVPFMEQDAQVDRCAHTAAWVCHYSAWVRHLVARRDLADFSLLADHSVQGERSLPSRGLTVGQVADLMRRFDLSPLLHDVSKLEVATPTGWERQPDRTDEEERANRITSISCRYLNSAFPLIVATPTHAFVLCGYWNEEVGEEGTTRTRLVRHDDQRGPYLVVDDIQSDVDRATQHAYGSWDYLVVPLPSELWVTGESVERKAAETLRPLAECLISDHPAVSAVLEALDARTLALRTYAQSSNHFKHQLVGRCDDEHLLREYRVARLPRFIWVVELVDRVQWEAGEASVLGEMIFDGTSSDWHPRKLAVHLPGIVLTLKSDGVTTATTAGLDRYTSGVSGYCVAGPTAS